MAFDQGYYEERKKDIDGEISILSKKIVDNFVRVFNDGHLELDRLTDKRRAIEKMERISAGEKLPEAVEKAVKKIEAKKK
jgi:hypothetical protein